jgi:NAD(P)-dependent dehydrogenase (short-subunit alcohol dehydrogenase family)
MTTQKKPDRLALVTGANRGLGFALCKQMAYEGFTVLLTARNLADAQEAAAKLKTVGDVYAYQLDVTDPESIQRLRTRVNEEYGRLDVLINNAGTLYDTWEHASTVDLAVVRRAFETNALGAWQMINLFAPLLQEGVHPRVVNVSSQAGSIDGMQAGTPAYNVSKAALNAITVMLAQDFRRTKMLINAVCPGWIATDMGGAAGAPVEQGVESVMWAVHLPDDGPSGGFFRHGKRLPW